VVWVFNAVITIHRKLFQYYRRTAHPAFRSAEPSVFEELVQRMSDADFLGLDQRGSELNAMRPQRL